jgi:hypothetical protein
VRYQGALLELSYRSSTPFQSAESLLADYHLAPSFQSARILLDPDGRLASLQAEVRREYPKAERVRQRLEHVERNMRGMAGAVSTWDVLHEQVTCTFFSAGLLTHILLVAGLRNPTVRLRYLAARELLAEHGRLDFYERLLDVAGYAALTPGVVREHLATLEYAFDEAGPAVRTPIFFATDLGPLGRPLAIDGSRELVERGNHREALFYIIATYARCMSVFYRDDWPELHAKHLPGFRRLIGDLGLASHDDLQARAARNVAMIPETLEVADRIMAATPGIIPSG